MEQWLTNLITSIGVIASNTHTIYTYYAVISEDFFKRYISSPNYLIYNGLTIRYAEYNNKLLFVEPILCSIVTTTLNDILFVNEINKFLEQYDTFFDVATKTINYSITQDRRVKACLSSMTYYKNHLICQKIKLLLQQRRVNKVFIIKSTSDRFNTNCYIEDDEFFQANNLHNINNFITIANINNIMLKFYGEMENPSILHFVECTKKRVLQSRKRTFSKR